jgi:hypothetical protein
MSTEHNEDLIRLAKAISDGKGVNWEKEISTRPELKAVLEKLREVESVTGILGDLVDEVRAEPELLKALAEMDE